MSNKTTKTIGSLIAFERYKMKNEATDYRLVRPSAAYVNRRSGALSHEVVGFNITWNGTIGESPVMVVECKPIRIQTHGTDRPTYPAPEYEILYSKLEKGKVAGRWRKEEKNGTLPGRGMCVFSITYSNTDTNHTTTRYYAAFSNPQADFKAGDRFQRSGGYNWGHTKTFSTIYGRGYVLTGDTTKDGDAAKNASSTSSSHALVQLHGSIIAKIKAKQEITNEEIYHACLRQLPGFPMLFQQGKSPIDGVGQIPATRYSTLPPELPWIEGPCGSLLKRLGNAKGGEAKGNLTDFLEWEWECPILDVPATTVLTDKDNNTWTMGAGRYLVSINGRRPNQNEVSEIRIMTLDDGARVRSSIGGAAKATGMGSVKHVNKGFIRRI